MMLKVTFAHPWAWFLMIIPILMALFHFYMGKYSSSYTLFSSNQGIKTSSLKLNIKRIIPWLSILAAVLLVIAIARPQDEFSKEKSSTKGIDIILAIDVSTSMLERDFSPNRTEAAKSVASEFVSKRPNDRIGVVVFAGESYTQCPPTIDHQIVQKQIKSIQNGIIEDGTAIGMGLATSVRALKNSNAKSKVCILLTDGVNTAGTIDPVTAIDIAKALNVKVYCIGVGTPKNNMMGIDEPLMQKIAGSTGGLYFRAGSVDRLKQIYDKINTLETYEIEVNSLHKKTDLFLNWALGAFALLLIAFLLNRSWLKTINN